MLYSNRKQGHDLHHHRLTLLMLNRSHRHNCCHRLHLDQVHVQRQRQMQRRRRREPEQQTMTAAEAEGEANEREQVAAEQVVAAAMRMMAEVRSRILYHPGAQHRARRWSSYDLWLQGDSYHGPEMAAMDRN